MASDLKTFRQLLVQYVDEGHAIPSFILRDNSDLGLAFSRIVTTEAPKEGETPGQTAGRYLDEICDTLALPDNEEAVSRFNDTVQIFISKIKNAWDNVSAIRETGHTLAEDMEKITNDQMNNNEFIRTHLNYGELKTDFPVFTWEGTKVMGSISQVIQNVNGLMSNGTDQPSDQINSNLFGIIIADMTKYGQVDDVQVTEETRQAAIDALMNVCQNAPAGTIERVVDAITGINKNCPVHAALSEMTNLAYAQVNLIKNITMFDDVITSFFPVLDLIVTEQVTPFPANKETVIENAKKIITVLELAAYYEYMQRTSTLKDVILLQGGLVNGDVEEEFKKANGTSKMLAEYIRFMYNDEADKIPVSGVRIGAIVDGAQAVSDKVAKDIANVEGRLAIARNNARENAFRMVMRDYLTKKFARENEGAQGTVVAGLVEKTMMACIVPLTVNIRQYNVNFLDVTMNAIVAVQYPKTFTEHLFNELGAAYINMTESNGNITAADVRQIDVAVISKLILTFLADNLVEYLPAE